MASTPIKNISSQAWREPGPDIVQFMVGLGMPADRPFRQTPARFQADVPGSKDRFSDSDMRLIVAGMMAYGTLRNAPFPSPPWLFRHMKPAPRKELESAELARLRLELFAHGVRFPVGGLGLGLAELLGNLPDHAPLIEGGKSLVLYSPLWGEVEMERLADFEHHY